METNKIFAPEYPAHHITPPDFVPEPRSAEPAYPSYSKNEAAHIAMLLSDTFKAECILLFGSLTGGTPHSDIAAYDLLVVTDEVPYYGVDSARRWLKLKMPVKHRSIPFINPHIYTRKFIAKNPSPIFHFAMSEGTALFTHKNFRLERPSEFDFGWAFRNTSRYYDTFINMAGTMLENAGMAFTHNDIRLTALYSAQASVVLLRTLFYVYHCFETDCSDPEILYYRLRTLSGELMLLCDGDQSTAQNTIPRMRKYLTEAHDKPVFGICAKTVEADMDRIEKMKEIVERSCRARISLYDQRQKH